MCSGTEAGSYLRRIDSCITQLKAQGPSRICNESKEEQEEVFTREGARVRLGAGAGEGGGGSLPLSNLPPWRQPRGKS